VVYNPTIFILQELEILHILLKTALEVVLPPKISQINLEGFFPPNIISEDYGTLKVVFEVFESSQNTFIAYKTLSERE